MFRLLLNYFDYLRFEFRVFFLKIIFKQDKNTIYQKYLDKNVNKAYNLSIINCD